MLNKAMNAMNSMKLTGGRRKAHRKASRKAHRKTQRKTRKNSRKSMKGGNNAPVLPMEGGSKSVGTRAEVMHGTAHHTSGGLTRKDLKYNKRGRIVSRRASEAGKKALRRLTRLGYKARKGRFSLFKRKH